jgi:hypothetical protein
MGDLNDDPTDKSVLNVLGAQKKNKNLSEAELFNPFFKLYKQGKGSNAYDDSWNNFDQIIINGSLTDVVPNQWTYDYVQIFKKNFMLRPSGRYKGYPLRTKAGGQYIGGYSDHFPVLIYFKRSS